LRVIPLDPGDLLPVRVPGGLHIEVCAAGEFDGPTVAGRIDQRKTVRAFITMDKEDLRIVGRDERRSRVPKGRGDGLRLAVGQPDAVQAAVGREYRQPVTDGEIAA